MWFFLSKKELKKELKKIQAIFKEKDKEIEKLKEKLESNSLKIATLEGSYLILSSKSQSQSQSSLKPVSSNYETKMIKRIRKSKKALIMAKIIELLKSHSVIEIFEIIVKEKKLCSKASFYRYISSLKSQKLIETETKVRLK